MGQRANLVVIEAGKRTLYYDHWCANRLDVELFWDRASRSSSCGCARPSTWPGWTVRWHLDRYEAHLELAAGQLVLPPAGDERSQILARLGSVLVREARNPAREALQRMGDVDAELSPATDATRGSAGDAGEKRTLLESLARPG